MSTLIDGQDAVRFRHFRGNLVGFLRLPPDVNETALRRAAKQCSDRLLSNYLARLDRVLKARLPPSMDS